MCGITGQLNFNNKIVNKINFKKMINLISHRGPDDFGYYFNNNLALGNVRLSIFDTTKNGHMPMRSKDGRYVISYNGEVYNWKEIRKDLKLNNWISETDTETVLQAYIEKGPECLRLFKGMFSISIWDNKKKEIFLARDREGIKPLYYFKSSEKIIFSSEIKSIIKSGVSKKINYGGLYNFLRWGLIDHSFETLYDNIFQIDPGQYLIVDNFGNTKIKKHYYQLKDNLLDYNLKNKEEISDIYFNKLNKIIKLYMRSDVKVGTLLSGGVDSSIITALITKNIRSDIEAFTYDFYTQGKKNYGESIKSKNLCKKLNIKNNVVFLTSSEVPGLFDKLMYFQELPITSIRILAEYKLNKFAKKKGFSVLISGDGGDQVAGGFEYYWPAIILDTIRNEGFVEGEKLLKNYMKHFGVKKNDYYKKIFSTLFATLNPGTTTTDGTPYFEKNFFKKEFLKDFCTSKFQFERPFDSDLLNSQYIDMKYHNIPRVLRMKDRASMAAGVEMRVPLLDTNLVEFGFSSPHNSRVNKIEQRHYMLNAARKYLNKIKISNYKTTIVDSQREWLGNELRDWAGDIINSSALKEIGIFDVLNIKKSFEKFCKNKHNDTSYNFFQIINIGYWYYNIFKKKIF